VTAGVTPMRVFAASDVGRVRTENQDCYFAGPIPAGREKSHGQLLIVADGMGGHASGEVASKLAVETILKVYYGEPLGLGADPSLLLRRAFQAANLAILEAGRREQRHFGMGTTCTALLLRAGLAWTCHVGDTRVYRYRDGALEQLTKDHTLLQQMIEGGQLHPDELLRRSIKHILVRAMGSEERVRLDASQEPFPVSADDAFLLTTDGLHDLLGVEEITALLAGDDGQRAVEALTEAAGAAGAPDNVTVLLARWDDSTEV
jgi:PPM family protein phosphatase